LPAFAISHFWLFVVADPCGLHLQLLWRNRLIPGSATHKPKPIVPDIILDGSLENLSDLERFSGNSCNYFFRTVLYGIHRKNGRLEVLGCHWTSADFVVAHENPKSSAAGCLNPKGTWNCSCFPAGLGTIQPFVKRL
jgi:hypothetical protein